MKWAEMTPRQRDQFVAERVMGWDRNAPCPGRFVPKDPEPDGLYCPTCQAEIAWGDKWDHDTPIPPAYTTDMSAAWSVLASFPDASVEVHAHLGRYRCAIQSASQHGYAERMQSPCEAICLAALRAVGVSIESEE